MPAAEPGEPGYLLDMAGQQQVVDHVEHEQRLHGIIGESLAGRGEAEKAEALGVAEEGSVVAVDLLEIRSRVGNRHPCALPLKAIILPAFTAPARDPGRTAREFRIVPA